MSLFGRFNIVIIVAQRLQSIKHFFFFFFIVNRTIEVTLLISVNCLSYKKMGL